jgi:hypothetical protein
MNNKVVKLLKYLDKKENQKGEKLDFHFLQCEYVMGGPKVEKDGTIKYFADKDLPELKKSIHIANEKTIQNILDISLKEGFTEYGTWGFHLTDCGRNYLRNLADKKSNTQQKWAIAIATGLLLPIVVSWVSNHYFTKSEIKVLQNQIVNIENKIKIQNTNK